MEKESLLAEVKPKAIILIPHIILIFFWIGLITIWKPLFAILGTQIRITNTRLSAKKGVIHTEEMESALNKVTSVKVSQNIFGKIFNYGTIFVNTAGGNYKFDYIPNPKHIKELIMKHNI